MRDKELTGEPQEQGGAPAAPPPLDAAAVLEAPAPAAPRMDRPAEGAAAGGRPPSWLRALLISAVVLAAGAALGALAYHFERAYAIQPPTATETATGWRISSHQGRRFSGLALHGRRLLWQNGPSIEYLDLESGKLRLLGPGPGMRVTWAPAVGSRYAVWFEAERAQSLAAQAIAYDFQSGRRWTIAEIGGVYSYPAISGGTTVWCSAVKLAGPRIWGMRIAGGDALDIAGEYGTPVIAEDLVVWARGDDGPFTAHELSGGRTWPVVPEGRGGTLKGFALAGRTLVWGQLDAAGAGTVAAASVDGGATQLLANGVVGLAGPAFDGETVVWAERAPGAPGARVMGRRLAGGSAFAIASVNDTVTEVAVSGETAAWLAGDGADTWIETTVIAP